MAFSQRVSAQHPDFQSVTSEQSSTPCETSLRGSCMVSKLCKNGSDSLHPYLLSETAARRTIHRGESIYRAGDSFTNLYQLYSGSMKLRVTNYAGLEQITSFPLAGTLLGLDGIETGVHTCDAVALEHSRVCILPFSELMALCGQDSGANVIFTRIIAREINYYRQLLLVLACMKSEERVANFLLDLGNRLAANGYSAHEFTLKMTREDIANHLGMKLETVSRIFTRLNKAGVLEVRRRHLRISDPSVLKRIGSG